MYRRAFLGRTFGLAVLAVAPKIPAAPPCLFRLDETAPTVPRLVECLDADSDTAAPLIGFLVNSRTSAFEAGSLKWAPEQDKAIF